MQNLKIEYNPTFKQNLIHIWEYIAKDSIDRANNFLNQLEHKINNLLNFPYKFRKSYYYNDKDIRDLIFKGYSIPYYIDTQNNTIVILDIFKWNKK